MKVRSGRRIWRYRLGVSAALLLGTPCILSAQFSSAPSKPAAVSPPSSLERRFFAAIRDGDTQKVIAYIPQGGVNVGPEAQHATYAEVEEQFQAHRGLYCKLFDSSCIEATINVGNSARTCSYRELLSDSQKVRTAASEVTRSGVRQAVLVAQVKNDKCPSQTLIDFIFNLQADGWRLFSIP